MLASGVHIKYFLNKLRVTSLITFHLRSRHICANKESKYSSVKSVICKSINGIDYLYQLKYHAIQYLDIDTFIGDGSAFVKATFVLNGHS